MGEREIYFLYINTIFLQEVLYFISDLLYLLKQVLRKELFNYCLILTQIYCMH